MSKLSSNPITARLVNSTCNFEVSCEATGKWLSIAYSSRGYSNEDKKKEMIENLKKVEYQFHKSEEEYGILWVTPPSGFWLSDGRLVSPCYEEGERVKAYYGSEEEIVAMNRGLLYTNK